MKAAERASNITRQLLSFSRRDMLQPTRIDLNEVVRDRLSMLRPLIGEHIGLELSLADPVEPIFADTGMIEQVLLNLCVDARDAMPERGQLSIVTQNKLFQRKSGECPAELSPGAYVMMAIRDSGCGIPEENLDSIFDPFFFTKEVGNGTGLGLVTVYGIVQQHDGAITVDSSPENGTTFKIYLPVALEAMTRTGRTENSQPTGGSETILVAEDDSMVRDIAVRILNDAGCHTLTAKDGQEAVQRFDEWRDEVELLLLRSGRFTRESYGGFLKGKFAVRLVYWDGSPS